jgi:hypothetical protein
MLTKARLQCLRQWALLKKQEISAENGEYVDPTDFTIEICERLQDKLAIQDDVAVTKTSTSGNTLGSFSGKMEEWMSAKRKLLAYLGRQRGRNGTPLSYVLRDEDERPEDVFNTNTEDIWDAPLNGRIFDADNYEVFQILRQWSAEGTATTHIDQYITTSDGRAAYHSLKRNYEGDDAQQAAITRARNTITNSYYLRDSDKYTFNTYCQKHQSAQNDLTRYKQPMDGKSAVQYFLRGIRNEKYHTIRSSIVQDAELRDNLEKAVIAFKTQIQYFYSSNSDQRSSEPKNFRSIGSASQNQYNRQTGNNNSGRFGKHSALTNDSDNPPKAPDDGLFLPKHITDQMTPKQRAIYYSGRDEARKREGSFPNNYRNVKANTSVLTPSDSSISSIPEPSPPNPSPPTDADNISNVSSNFGQRRMNNSRYQGGFSSTQRRVVSNVQATTPVPTQDYTGRFRLEVDSRADTTCCGKGFVPISEVDTICDVLGFHPDMAPITNIPIRTCATAFDHHSGETLILEFGQCLYFGDALEHSLLSPNQVRSFHHSLCLTPKQYSNGTTLHGIRTDDASDNIELNFKMFGCISYLPIRTPTPDELTRCRRILLTAEDEWNPYSDHFARSEDASLPLHLRTIHATSSREHQSSINSRSINTALGN